VAPVMLGINTLAGSNSAHHVYELRLYHVNGGKMETLRDRFGNHTDAIFKRHNILASLLGEIRLDELWAGMDVDLAQKRLAGVNESMRCVRRDNDDATGGHLAVFIAHGNGGAAFESESDFDVGMFV
jgi:hypothetical protein